MKESKELSNGEELRLCDSSGRIVGIFLSAAALEQMSAERERLAKEGEELRKRLDEAQQQIALLEQDGHSMFRLLPREYQVTEEDIKEIQRDPHRFEEVLQMWEQDESS